MDVKACSLKALIHPSILLIPVGVTSHVFINTLNSDFQPGAAVVQHVTEVALQAIVRPRLYGDSHTFSVAALRVPAGKKLHPSVNVISAYEPAFLKISLALTSNGLLILPFPPNEIKC